MENIVAIMPCYKSSKMAIQVAKEVLRYVNFLICVDDCCPENTGKLIEQKIKDDKIEILYHHKNKGIGAAMKTGIKYSKHKKPTIIVKIDSDGQMNPKLIPLLIEPIINGSCDVTKGNRFTNPSVINKMPPIRLIGNIGLGFITKLSTGYWELFDPTNGYIAMSTTILNKIQLDKIDERYFFETDLLFRCGLTDILISEIPMEAKYDAEISSLRPFLEFFRFTYKHMKVFMKRILYQYFLFDFNPGSLSLCLGLLLGIFSLCIGLRSFFYYNHLGIVTPIGIQILFLASSLICNQLLISFIFYDASQRPLLRRLKGATRSIKEKSNQ